MSRTRERAWGLRTVVVDDDDISRVMMLAILRKWGYGALAAKNGRDAEEILRASREPVIGLLDWHLPDTDGISVCRELATLRALVPVHLVVLTSMRDGDEGLRALEAGADDFLPKPYSVDELDTVVLKAERHLELQARLLSQA